MTKYNEKLLYEAPSTAHQNISDPLLEIGAQEHITPFLPHVFLPEEIKVCIKNNPLFCVEGVHVSLTKNFVSLGTAPLYQNERPLQAIQLTLEQEHTYIFRGDEHSFNEASLYHLDEHWSFQFDFQWQIQSMTLEENKRAPYGGLYHWDPACCQQQFFYAFMEDGQIKIVAQPLEQNGHHTDMHLSLSECIKTHGIRMPLFFQGEAFIYRSYSYHIKNAQSLIIHFIL